MLQGGLFSYTLPSDWGQIPASPLRTCPYKQIIITGQIVEHINYSNQYCSFPCLVIYHLFVLWLSVVGTLWPQFNSQLHKSSEWVECFEKNEKNALIALICVLIYCFVFKVKSSPDGKILKKYTDAYYIILSL